MKTMLLAACAAVLVAGTALPAGAETNGNGKYDGNSHTGYKWPYRYAHDHNDWYYWNDNRRYGWRHDWDDDDWRPGYGGDYYRHGVLPPHRIAHILAMNHYTYITRPVLSGPYYQVKAIAPNGRKVKLYVDPYSGYVVRAKKRD
jgi:hypothetical protein